jgi:hypothetical protein
MMSSGSRPSERFTHEFLVGLFVFGLLGGGANFLAAHD